MATEILTVRAGITNIFLLHGRGTIAVDPGGPPSGRMGFRKVLPLLGAPPRLDLIVLTHGHIDHRAAGHRVREATGAPVAVHRADLPLLAAGAPRWPKGVTPWGRVLRGVLAPLVACLRAPSLEPDLLLGDEGLDLEPYGVQGRVVHTPGHTAGSVSVILSSGEAFVGDLVMNRLPLCRRPSFGLFAERPELHAASWQCLLDLGMRRAYPAHGLPFEVENLFRVPGVR